jgi:signal recognition particle receptor subunit beta
LSEVPILVLANKKDLRDAMTASELTTALALTDVKVHSRSAVSACACAFEAALTLLTRTKLYCTLFRAEAATFRRPQHDAFD